MRPPATIATHERTPNPNRDGCPTAAAVAARPGRPPLGLAPGASPVARLARVDDPRPLRPPARLAPAARRRAGPLRPASSAPVPRLPGRPEPLRAGEPLLLRPGLPGGLPQ